MMKDELYNKLLEHIQDEVKDVVAYSKLMDEESGYAKMVLRSIARDEESHARYLMDIIKRDGRDVPENIMSSYRDVRNRFRDL